jgi:CBS domain containing-hemolysin-like protein
MAARGRTGRAMAANDGTAAQCRRIPGAARHSDRFSHKVFNMEWLFDPGIWVGLLTLVLLEIVLGIDNLIFIAILADKVPPHQRDKARLVGLSLAMLMRLGLLTMISWLVTLTTPLFSLGGLDFSGRDLILLLGGIFLLFKATMELHERLEGRSHAPSGPREYAGLGVVIAQIVVLDAVFSLDAVITAVGMVDELGVMMAAVVISMAVMILASKPLTRFVNAHPTVVVLCLSFLLMIGLSLVAEGLGFKIPKGYLYAAIGFSIVIEFFNQLAHRNFVKQEAHVPLRNRTAEAVLRLLGSRTRAEITEDAADNVAAAAEAPAFGTEERNMVSGVLTLAQRSIRSIMTPRSEMSWINLDADPDAIRRQVLAAPHSFFPVCRGDLDNIIGVARAKDLVADLAAGGAIGAGSGLREAIVMPESVGVLRAIDTLKRSRGQLVLVADEYGTIQGLVTPIDILEAIAGEFPDEDEQPTVQAQGPGRWRVDGTADLHYLEQVLGTDILVGDDDDYTSLAGFLLERFTRLPAVGEGIELDGLRFDVAEVRDRRIATVTVSRVGGADPAA